MRRALKQLNLGYTAPTMLITAYCIIYYEQPFTEETRTLEPLRIFLFLFLHMALSIYLLLSIALVLQGPILALRGRRSSPMTSSVFEKSIHPFIHIPNPQPTAIIVSRVVVADVRLPFLC